MNQTDSMEVYRLSGQAYIQRILYFAVTTLLVIGGTVIAIGEFMASPLDALYVLPATILIIALGVNTGYHMYFTHHSFDAAPAFKYLLAYLGSITCQDSIAQWVSNHKRHHRHTDSADLDPHSPHKFGDSKWAVLTLGLAWATFAWKFSRTSTSKAYYSKELLIDPVIAWFDKYYVAVSWSGFVIPFVLGYLASGMDLAIKWFAYFGAFRVFTGYFFTEFVVNGLCHAIGTSKFKTNGHPGNLARLSWLTLGTTLHHNHHAFPRALSPAIDGEWDPMNVVYAFLEKTGAMYGRREYSPEEVELKRLEMPEADATQGSRIPTWVAADTED